MGMASAAVAATAAAAATAAVGTAAVGAAAVGAAVAVAETAAGAVTATDVTEAPVAGAAVAAQPQLAGPGQRLASDPPAPVLAWPRRACRASASRGKKTSPRGRRMAAVCRRRPNLSRPSASRK